MVQRARDGRERVRKDVSRRQEAPDSRTNQAPAREPSPPAGLSWEALEAPEISGYRDFFAAAPTALAARYGLTHAERGGADCTVAEALPGMRLLNHALGLRGNGREAADRLDAVEAFFADHGADALVAVPEGSSIEATLVARGYARDYAWQKFVRASGPPAAVSCALAIHRVDTNDADIMGRLIASGFGLPADMGEWFASLADRPGWHCFGAYDDSELVGCGALYARGDAGWLTWAATDPLHRGRGAQKALLAARIAHARHIAVDVLVTETGEQEPDRPDASYRNILGAGFRPVFRRPCWRRAFDGPRRSGEAGAVHPPKEAP